MKNRWKIILITIYFILYYWQSTDPDVYQIIVVILINIFRTVIIYSYITCSRTWKRRSSNVKILILCRKWNINWNISSDLHKIRNGLNRFGGIIISLVINILVRLCAIKWVLRRCKRFGNSLIIVCINLIRWIRTKYYVWNLSVDYIGGE